MDLTFFNPRAQKEADFLAAFCARQNTLEFFLRQLRRLAGSQATAQHHLIVAPRGYGKTSLLRRIAIAIRQDDSLRAHWLPLSFREEQHNVISLDVLWQNCLQSLQEALDSEGADEATLDALDDVIDQHAPRSQLKREAQDGRPAESYLLDYCRRHGRRPLLLIDNLDALLAGLSTEHQWAWRASLQAANGPVLLAAAARYPQALRDHDAAFYDFFRLHPLERLSDAEVMQCLSHIARQRGDKGAAVLDQLQRQPGKIATLNTLAGGNPRTLSVLYSVLEAHMSEDALDNLSAMLDQFTGWYQARTEELPMQARAVFDAVALHWDPITAAQLASVTGLEVTVINSQLSRLDKQGYIEAVKLSRSGKGRNAYQVSERFYNIWYLMRHGSRRLERRIRFLTAFLQSLYTPDECQRLGERLLQRTRIEPATALALAHNLPVSETRECLLDAVEAQLDNDPSLAQEYHKVRRAIAEQGQAASQGSQTIAWPASVATLIAQECYTHAEAVLRQALERAPDDASLWFHLGRLLNKHLGRYEEAEAAYRQAIELDAKYAYPWNGLGNLLQYRLGRYEEAEAAYRQAIELDAKYAYPWNGLGNLLQYRLGRYEEAEAAYRQAMELDAKYASPWNGLGNLLQYRLGRYEEAEAAYRQAIELDAKFASPWNGLGNLLKNRLGRYEEAEAAYRQAIELDAKYASPWNGLGKLLQDHLGRYEEAEAAYRQAIELDAKFAYPWNHLGKLLQYRLGRYEEAEAAYRQAIELDAKYAYPWNNLGKLLQDHLGRYEEAEAAYRQAIELDAKYAYPWNNLGKLLQDHLGRYEEAEAAYRQAIELDAKFASPWANLGNLLQYRLGRYEEAEAAYRQAIELDAKYAYPWANLGNLLQYRLGRYEEAEAAYRQAIELDAKYAYPWANLGNLLQYRLGRYEEAEAAYRQAIELDAKYAYPWANLGNLLQYRLGRYEEAEAAYRQAIELDAKFAYPWANLGNLLQYHLGRYEEAEAAYRQAIELDAKFAYPWANLGNLLKNRLERYEEAEAAYRQAIELDAKYAYPWNGLGNLLQDHLGRYEEAEAAYRQAIELDSAFSYLWDHLGNLRQDGLGWLDAAQEAYLAGLALTPDDGFLNANLAYLLSLRLQQPLAAQPYLEKALKSAELSAAGQSLLHALAQAPAGPASVWSGVQQALVSEDSALFVLYQDDLQRLLVWLVEQGYGTEMRAQMLANKDDEHYAPLYHAVLALLDGEDHLLTINPETRGAAQCLYAGMARMRRCWRTPQAVEGRVRRAIRSGLARLTWLTG